MNDPNMMGMNNNLNMNMNNDPNTLPPPATPVITPPVYEPPSTPLMSNQYAQPIVAPPMPVQPVVSPAMGQMPPNQLVVNQVNPVVVLPPDIFKSTPVNITCPFCNRNITTQIRETFNCATCCLCLCTSPLLYVCIQLVRGKDLCCYDVDHSCPYCSNRLGSYTSC